jgi:hypothetical protein
MSYASMIKGARSKGDRNQIKLMRSCGFSVFDEYGGNRIWGRGELRIALQTNRSPSLMRLVSHIIDQTIYRVKKRAVIDYGEVVTKNEP